MLPQNPIQLIPKKIIGYKTRRAIGIYQKDNNLSLAVQELNDRDRQAFGISNGGVIVRDVMRGPAFDAGIRVGDVILELANKKVTGFNSYKLITRNLKKGSVIPVLISRQKSPLYIALRIPSD